MQASLTREHERAIDAGSGQAAWPVAERLSQKLRNLLGEFCIDIFIMDGSPGELSEELVT